MEKYYLFYSQKCPDCKIFLDNLSKLQDNLILSNIQYFAIESGQFPQNLQRVPAIMIDKSGEQQLLEGQNAFVWLNDKNVGALNSESTSSTAFSFISNDQQSAIADRVSTPWSTTQEPSPQDRYVQGPTQTQRPPNGLNLPQPQNMKNNNEQQAQQNMDRLLEERNRALPMPPARVG